ncbi:Bacteriophytochrome [Flavobacterium limnosediminis JC2902]|uniref:histidine kinase n=1 Tax=Flavobacterium limnosediminis JC2902 TaxID=1341181 RepID=V6SMZ8_9FLAO|nr:PAS domain-containing protein [Flavobacterium limnosediminis]ESU25775.1 Bacteriophytochrome [Flavobacterium limnosediminis JC2902]
MARTRKEKGIDKLILECDTAKMFFAEEAASSYVVSLKDVTEQVAAQEKLAFSEKRFKALVQQGANITSILDPMGVYLYVSPNYPDNVGYTEEELLGKNAFNYIHPDDVAQIKSDYTRLLSEKRVKSSIYRFKHKNGDWCFFQSVGSNLIDDETIGGIVVNSMDITDQVTMQNELNRSNERSELLMKAGSECIWDFDLVNGELFMNESFKENFGIESKAMHENFEIYKKHLHPADSSHVLDSFFGALEDINQEKWIYEYRMIKSDGAIAHVRDQAIILRDQSGMAYRSVGAIKDVTAEYYYRQFDILEKEIMEYSMSNEVKIRDVITFYIGKLEHLFPDMRASMMRIRNNRLENLASPSLPTDYVNTIEGMLIGNNAGSCGTAAYLKEKVVVTDISTDIRWKDYKKLAEKYGFGACWSYPIFNSDGKVVATVAYYYATPRTPNAIEEQGTERSLRLLSALIEKFEYLNDIRKNNERYELINKASQDAIYEWDILKDQVYWSESFYTVFGYAKNKSVFRNADWNELTHVSDIPRIKKEWADFLADTSQYHWTKEFRFRKADGTYAFVQEIGHLIRDEDGQPLRIIGVLKDVSSVRLDEMQKEQQHQVSQIFKKEVALNQILAEVLEYLTVQGGFQTAEIWLGSTDGKHLNITSKYAQSNKGEQFFKASHVRRLEKGEGLPGYVWQEGHIEIWDAIDRNPLFRRKESAEKAGLKSAMGIPLFDKDRVVGVLVFSADTEDFFSKLFLNHYETLQFYLGDEIKRKQQEEEMFLLFHSAPEIMAVVSPERHFVKVNPAFCSLLGYDESEITGKPFDTFIHPDDLERSVAEYSEAIASKGRVFNSIVRYRTQSGRYRSISWSSSEVFGDERHVFAYGRDVTEVIELQGLLETASKLSRVGGWEVDPVNDVLYWSPMTKAIHEVSDDFQPDTISALNFFREDVREEVRSKVKTAIEKRETFDFEMPIITGKGNERWVRCIGNAEYSDDECVRLYGSFQDIHNQKITEINLQKLFEERNNILESIGDAFFAVDRDWTVTYWNKEAVKVLSRKREEVIGKSLWDSFPESVGSKSHIEYSRAMQKGEVVHFEDYYPPLNQWFEISAYPSEKGLSVYFKDISIRKTAEEAIRESNKRFEKVTEATNDAIWDWDIQTDDFYRSEGFDRLLGYKLERGIDSDVFRKRHFSPDDIEKITENVTKAITDPKTNHWEMEYSMTKKDGTNVYVFDRGAIIRNKNGKAIRMIGAMTDITYRREYEESLKNLNARLEQQTNELMISNKELEQFAYVASHDLQEPLRMVTSFLTQLKRKYSDQLDEKANQYIHFAVDGSLRMRQIILDILEFSRVGKYDESKNKVDLNEIVQEVCQLQHRLILEKQASIHFQHLPVITSYRSPILQVFQNLIGNALKYSRPNVPVVIEVTAEEYPDEWQISVKDNGVGIDKDYHEKIFILFQRLHVREEYKGTGIGLAIVKKILDNLGGKIWVASEEGQGSTFYFTLPK